MASTSASTRKNRPPRWPAGLVPRLQAVIRAIEDLYRRVGMQLTIEGGTAASVSGEDGNQITARVNPGATSTGPAPALWLTKTGSDFTFSAGTFNDQAVLWDAHDGDEIDDSDPPVFSATNVRGYLEVEYDMTWVEGWLADDNPAFTACIKRTTGSVPANVPVDGLFRKELFRIVSGAITVNRGGTNFVGLLRDASTLAASNARHAIARA